MKREIPKKKNGRPTKRPDTDYLINLYEHYTATEIASMYGVAESTVRSWISRLRKEYAQDE